MSSLTLIVPPADSLPPPAPASPPQTPRRALWKRWLLDPLLNQLTQGITPDHLAATLAVGTACSMLPFFGFSGLLNFLVGLKLRMNQPILQTLNQLLGPVHFVMIFVYVSIGEWLWGVDHGHFSVVDMLRTFRDEPFSEFLHRFGWAGIHAATAWALSVPFIIVTLYYSLRPLMRRLAQLRLQRAAAAAPSRATSP